MSIYKSVYVSNYKLVQDQRLMCLERLHQTRDLLMLFKHPLTAVVGDRRWRTCAHLFFSFKRLCGFLA